jgi:hypothetical protein
MVTVSDPFSAGVDASMPELALALNPEHADALLKRGLPTLSGDDGILRLRRITVLRHKPGKRCLIEYRVRADQPNIEPRRVSIIGKIRAKRFGQSDYRLQQQFWERGFSKKNPDGIAVPEPLGHIPELRMWFQRMIKGETATTLIQAESGAPLAKRIAEAAFKIHRSGVPTDKTHQVADELRILQGCFASVTASNPELETRLEKLWQSCVCLGATLEGRPMTGIHRDFYSDQILVRGKRLYLIDFDLYCQGDPALDIGNFTGHLTELALRVFGRSDALIAAETTIVERFLELAGEEHRNAIAAYHLLTLVRHVYLSTQFEERRALTEPLLTLCEDAFHSMRTR